MNDVLAWLEQWYADRCDGAWEHSFGIKIGNIDNPGWHVEIDVGSELCNAPARELDLRDGLTWSRVEVKDGKFIGVGGPNSLRDIVLEFAAIWEAR